MGFYMRSPVYTPNDPVKSVKQLHSWLYQLNENLKFMFSNLDSDNFTGEFSACFSEEAMMKTQEDIRKLDDEIGRLSKTGAWEKAELNGFTPADDENAPSYMVAGGFVYVTGEAINISRLPGGAEIKALTLPKALCPRRKQEFLCRAGAYILAVIVNTDGGVCIFNPGAQELPQNSEVVFSFSYGL